MLKRHNQLLVGMLFVSDMLIVAGAWLLAYYVRIILKFPDSPYDQTQAPFEYYLYALGLVVPVHALCFMTTNLYRPRRGLASFSEAFDIVRSELLAYLIIIVAYFFYHTPAGFSFSRVVVMEAFVLTAFSLLCARFLVRAGLYRMRQRGWNLRYALIVGSGKLGQEVLEVLQRHNSWGIQVKGYVDDKPERQGKNYHGVPVLGTTEDLSRLIREQGVDQIYLATPMEEWHQLGRVVDSLGEEVVDVRIIPDLREFAPLNPQFGDLDGLPILSLRESPLDTWNAFVKRSFDLGFSLLILTLLSPLLALIALAIKLTSRGPVFYAQERMGLDGRVFKMLKFRSMRTDAEIQTGAVWAQENDPRRTRFGTWLRQLSIDEIPQFINVLKGDMSVVGPRPERPVFIEEFRKKIPRYMLRHKMKAGITGWAQVNGWRGNTPLEKRIQYDLYYIENWSFWFDVRIVLMTLTRGMVNKNAY